MFLFFDFFYTYIGNIPTISTPKLNNAKLKNHSTELFSNKDALFLVNIWRSQ